MCRPSVRRPKSLNLAHKTSVVSNKLYETRVNLDIGDTAQVH